MLPTVAATDHHEISDFSNIEDFDATKNSTDHSFMDGIEHFLSSPEIPSQKRTSAKQEYEERFSKQFSSTKKVSKVNIRVATRP